MLGIIFGALGNLLGGPFAKAALDAYRASFRQKTRARKSQPISLHVNWQSSSASVS